MLISKPDVQECDLTAVRQAQHKLHQLAEAGYNITKKRTTMFENYLKIAWRNLKKNTVFSLINVIGLTAGLACCMMITLYIIHETSYDGYHANAGSIYQLETIFIKQGQRETSPNTPAPMAMAMQRDFPEVANATRLMRLFAEDKTLLQYTDRKSVV